MLYDNFAMLTKRELLIRIVKLLKEENLVDGVKYIPVEMRPKNKRPIKCCVHKDRYILKHKIISILGFEITDEEIDLIPLSEFAQKALDNKNTKENILSVVHEACSACMQSQYFVTNMCRGCEGRPCLMNCPKAAISFKGGKACITQEDCVGCGLCSKVCPYHAIVYTPVPCEDVCPVKAITKGEDGTEHIDKDKCIYCGKCMQTCPYGAIMERSKVIDVYKSITAPDKKIIAIPAPAIYGQFNATPGQILSAIKAIGFDDVVEVALGAEDTSRNEAAEFLERMEEGKPFMTTSCCPAFVNMIRKHFPRLQANVSTTVSPMVALSRWVREKYPQAKVVFIGPCVAKKTEQVEGGPDYVLTTEEIVAMMDARKIDPDKMEADPVQESSTYGKGFASSGGVTSAVMQVIQEMGEVPQVSAQRCNGAAECKKALMMLQAGKFDMDFIEGMACEGGCMYGPGNLLNERLYTQARKKFLGEADDRGVIENAKEQGFDQIHMHR